MALTQLSSRLKNFLRGWLLVLDLKEGLVECATVCVKSVVILLDMAYPKIKVSQLLQSLIHRNTFEDTY